MLKVRRVVSAARLASHFVFNVIYPFRLFAMELKKLLLNGKINRVKQICLLSIILKITNNRNEF